MTLKGPKLTRRHNIKSFRPKQKFCISQAHIAYFSIILLMKLLIKNEETKENYRQAENNEVISEGGTSLSLSFR